MFIGSVLKLIIIIIIIIIIIKAIVIIQLISINYFITCSVHKQGPIIKPIRIYNNNSNNKTRKNKN
jgi:hypothetical protein